jgi:hypothetical protein
MKLMLRVIFLFLIFTPSSIFAGDLTDQQREQVIDLATKVLVPLKTQLISTLQEEYKAHGVLGALDACQVKAQPITASVQENLTNVSLGRASHKTRNPVNQPKEWMKEYFSGVNGGQMPSVQVLKLEGNRFGYLEPIMTGMPLCLQCHGEEIEGPVLSKILELYPNDEARGFKLGDFRGVFWVEGEIPQLKVE